MTSYVKHEQPYIALGKWILCAFVFFSQQATAAPGNLVWAVSRANCWAPFPFGIGGGVGWHNESVSYDPLLKNHDLWTHSYQSSVDPKRDVVRWGNTGWDYTWRSYQGVADSIKDIIWKVTGSHWERVDYIKYYSFYSYGTDCNLNNGGKF